MVRWGFFTEKQSNGKKEQCFWRKFYIGIITIKRNNNVWNYLKAVNSKIMNGGKREVTVINMDDLLRHKGHELVIASYGKPLVENVTIECLDCNEVLYEESRDN